MTRLNDLDEPTRTVAQQVKELRGARGWSGPELVAALATEGVEWDRSVVANFENGRRRYVSVQELLALARVLGVAPVHLLVPPAAEDYAVTPATTAPAAVARAWIRGGDRSLSLAPEWYGRWRPEAETQWQDYRLMIDLLEQTGVITVDRDRDGRPLNVRPVNPPEGWPMPRGGWDAPGPWSSPPPGVEP